MRLATFPVIGSALFGLTIGASAILVHAHGSSGHHGPPGDHTLLSIAGSPTQLAERSLRLATHVCAVVESAEHCPLQPLAETAAADLNALKDTFEQGQQDMHRALTQANLDPVDVRSVQDQQLALLEQSQRRYLDYLLAVSAQLSAEQRQAFAH